MGGFGAVAFLWSVLILVFLLGGFGWLLSVSVFACGGNFVVWYRAAVLWVFGVFGFVIWVWWFVGFGLMLL